MHSFTTAKAIGLAFALIISGATTSTVLAQHHHRGGGGGPPAGRGIQMNAPRMNVGPTFQRGPSFNRGPAMMTQQRFTRAPALVQNPIYQRRVYDRGYRYNRYHRGSIYSYGYGYRSPFIYLGGPRIIVRGYGPGWCRGLHRGSHWAPRIGRHWGRHYGLYRCW